MTLQEVLKDIRARMGKNASMDEIAKAHGIHRSTLYNIFSERKGVGPRVLKALGYRATVVSYERIKEK